MHIYLDNIKISTQEKRFPYTASKRGLVGLIQAAALDYA